MTTLLALLFLLCSPIAKYEFPQGWEGSDGGITIEEVVTNGEGEVVSVSWSSETPICNARIKAGNEEFDIPMDPPEYEGTIVAFSKHGISHIEFSSAPTAVEMAGAFDGSTANRRTEKVMVGIVVALMIFATALLLYRDRQEH